MPLTSASRAARPQSTRRGGVIAWCLGALATMAAIVVLGWMLLLPGVVQSRFLAATGAQLRFQGLMGDPFAGRATVTGWTLHASAAPDARLLARGGPSEITAADWRAALATDPTDGVATIDSLRLTITDALLAPDAKGTWPLLALGAASGLPYELNGPIGQTPRIRIRHLALAVDTVRVRDGRTGAEVPVRIAWRGEFRDVTHTRPILTALLAAVRASSGQPKN
ncbi:MAG: hypothetical protein MUE42_08800 [Opitutaceae bacterium]|jgi:hypothetical protein|nr:hypothetical protein [Opitutaceae bacterium]